MPIPPEPTAALARTRGRFVAALMALAVLAPAALFAAQYPKWWLWIALEQTPMTWLQSVLLVLAAGAAALVAVAGRARGWSRWQRLPYAALSLGLAALALDERFAIHERVRDRLLAPRDVRIPGLSWVAPGDFLMLLVAVAGLVVLPLLLRVLRHDRLALVLLCLGVGIAAIAVGLDSIDPATMPLDVERAEQTAEECLELLADCLLLAAIGVRLLALLGEPDAPAGVPGVAGEGERDTVRLLTQRGAAAAGPAPASPVRAAPEIPPAPSQPKWSPSPAPEAATVPSQPKWSPAPAPELTTPHAAHR